jgi:hypothetical protein
MRSSARGGRLSTKLAIDSMRRTRCWTLAFLVVLGLAVPMCAQSADPVDDPLALYTKKQVQYGMNQYCWVDWSLGTRSCQFADMESCSEARLKAFRNPNPFAQSLGKGSSCERNPLYQPSEKE